MRLLLALLLAQSASCALVPNGATEGRAGNRLLASGEAEAAAAAFREGLLATEAESGDVRAALWHNLGLALYAQEDFPAAASAFDEALRLSVEAQDRAQAAFHAGTARARAADLDAALADLRRALVARPDFPEARHNFEWVKRRLDGDAAEDEAPPEPSDFAQRLKAQADSLVAARQYRAALDLLADGFQQDSTVAAYADFAQRLADVVEIEETVPADSAR